MHPRAAGRINSSTTCRSAGALALIATGVDPLQLTMISVALTVMIMPLVGLPFLVLMNDPKYVKDRAQVNPNGAVVREVVVGMLGLLERLDLGARLIVGVKPRGGCIAQWNQIDFTNPSKPRLLVDVDALGKLCAGEQQVITVGNFFKTTRIRTRASRRAHV